MRKRRPIHWVRDAVLAAIGAAALVLILARGPTQAPEGPSITTVSWGGSYGRAYRDGIQVPFAEETGINVGMEDYNGGLAQIRAQVDVGSVYWDVVDLEMADAMRGCDEGLLEPIDIDRLPPAPDGTPAREDFYLEMQGECGAGMLFYSTVYAYNADLFPDEKPTTMVDFFDLEKFPGRRGMRRVPQVNLEFALIGDGVPLEEVYATLDTPEGLDRAFDKLDSIKDEVIWWEAGAQPPQMLADGEVGMSTAYNGRIFNAQVLEDQPFVIVWDGQLLDYGQLSIVAGTPRLEDALRFVSFATSAQSLAEIASRISYGPARRSGEPLVTTHLATGVEMAPHLPTSPRNIARALRNDWAWWVDNQDELNERFSAWLTRGAR
ncbi:ABC transporter substrate-binding protein [Candidatus Palauibacter sp.]|uniref:ABC transporter substrate-binding protein n=1 Tax=Candidatus Palauibacter sp. TaxID=3101350 RepID=UPI003B016A33